MLYLGVNYGRQEPPLGWYENSLKHENVKRSDRTDCAVWSNGFCTSTWMSSDTRKRAKSIFQPRWTGPLLQGLHLKKCLRWVKSLDTVHISIQIIHACHRAAGYLYNHPTKSSFNWNLWTQYHSSGEEGKWSYFCNALFLILKINHQPQPPYSVVKSGLYE